MCYTLKYGTWKWNEPWLDAVNGLVSGGYAPLVAMVLAARGFDTAEKAKAYLSCDCQLPDPYRLRDMDKAVTRVRKAMEEGEKLSVFGSPSFVYLISQMPVK